MPLILHVTLTDDLTDPEHRQILTSTELRTSMEPGMLVREVWALLQRVTDASPNLDGGPVLDGQRELEPPPPMAGQDTEAG